MKHVISFTPDELAEIVTAVFSANEIHVDVFRIVDANGELVGFDHAEVEGDAANISVRQTPESTLDKLRESYGQSVSVSNQNVGDEE